VRSFAALALLVLAAAPGATATGATRTGVVLLGRSVEGRPIEAVEVGDRNGPTVLVVGCVHGDESAGLAVARRLRRMSPRGLDLWIVPDLNPDGLAAGVRVNGRGVDLNRNWSAGWRPAGRRWDPEFPGLRPFSEPETCGARRLIERVRPELTLWFHQPASLVRAWGGSVRAARIYAGLVGLPFRRLPWPAGTAPNWQNHRWPGTSSFVVELPPGRLAAGQASRYAHAVLALAARLGCARC
jgi:murein peptide amidase A